MKFIAGVAWAVVIMVVGALTMTALWAVVKNFKAFLLAIITFLFIASVAFLVVYHTDIKPRRQRRAERDKL